MADIVSQETRSRMMSGIKGKNTKPELLIRRGLHKMGFRYSLHSKGLPGKPDLVFRKYRAVMFIHGCFWHRHHCHLFKMPSTRREFWETKLNRNCEIDARTILSLRESGWRLCIIWECAIKGKHRRPLDEVLRLCSKWLCSKKDFIEITGLE